MCFVHCHQTQTNMTHWQPRETSGRTHIGALERLTSSYNDHSNEKNYLPPELGDRFLLHLQSGRSGTELPFPVKLHHMLEKADELDLSSIVSWQSHGRCFVVHKQKEFVEQIMKQYFRQTKFPSFQRQLNLYGFKRITTGRDKGGYYHELLLRGKRFLSYQIHRLKIKGTKVRQASSPASEPDFYSMPFLPTETCKSIKPGERPNNTQRQGTTKAVIDPAPPLPAPDTPTKNEYFGYVTAPVNYLTASCVSPASVNTEHIPNTAKFVADIFSGGAAPKREPQTEGHAPAKLAEPSYTASAPQASAAFLPASAGAGGTQYPLQNTKIPRNTADWHYSQGSVEISHSERYINNSLGCERTYSPSRLGPLNYIPVSNRDFDDFDDVLESLMNAPPTAALYGMTLAGEESWQLNDTDLFD